MEIVIMDDDTPKWVNNPETPEERQRHAVYRLERAIGCGPPNTREWDLRVAYQMIAGPDPFNDGWVTAYEAGGRMAVERFCKNEETKARLRQRLVAADIRCRQAKQRFNVLLESGVKGPRLERAEEKTQAALDRFNELEAQYPGVYIAARSPDPR